MAGREQEEESVFRELSRLVDKWEKYSFLFSQLASRDFKKKYKRTVLGVFWSVSDADTAGHASGVYQFFWT